MPLQRRTGFIVTTALNVFLTLLSAYLSLVATDGDIFATVVLSLLVFMIGLCITILVEVQSRSETMLAEVRSTTESTLGELSARTDAIDERLAQQMSDSDRLGQLLLSVADGASYGKALLSLSQSARTVVNKFGGTAVEDEALRLIFEVRDDLAELSKGVLLVDSFDPSLKVRLLNTSDLGLYTTSLTRTDLAFYLHPDGRHYWNEQKRALAARRETEDVVIERIFIWDYWSDDLVNMINEHHEAGVRVFLVEESRLPIRDRVDVTHWGDKYTFRQHHTERPPGSGNWYDRFSINYSDIREAQNQYRRIRRLSHQVTAPLPPPTRQSPAG